MLYLFTGNNSYLLKQEVLRWKEAFKEKHGEENITHIQSLQGQNPQELCANLTARSLFNPTRLIILEGCPQGSEDSFAGLTDIESTLMNVLNDIPDETIVIFSNKNPDKRKGFYKTLSKTSQIKDFSASGEQDVYMLLSKKYGQKVEEFTLKRIIALKAGNLEKSISEIDKLLITHDRIEIEHITGHISAEFEESIFTFIGSLLDKNGKTLFKELEILLGSSNLYAIYQSVIANLRTHLYIELLKSQKKSPKQISDILKLGNRSFLASKTYKTSYKKISLLYTDLLIFDKNMKFGKYLLNEEDDLKRELKQIFLKFMT